MNNWHTGSGESITFDEIVDIIKEHSKRNGNVFVGTDSFVQKKKCIFSTAIALANADGQKGGRYFFKKNKFNISKYNTLMQRITSEVQYSIDIGMKILQLCPKISIELHLDISDSDKNTKTSKFSEMLVGYAKGNGFDCKIKPDAFAATSIADKHSK